MLWVTDRVQLRGPELTREFYFDLCLGSTLFFTDCSLTVCEPQPDGTYQAEVVVDTSHLTSPEPVATTRYV